MAFNPIYVTRISYEIAPSAALGIPLSQTQWSYTSTTDTIAQISAPGYFVNNATYAPFSFWLKIDDLIFCACADGIYQCTISAISPSIATIPLPIGQNTVSNLQLDPMEIQYVKVPISSINNMFSSPIQIVAPAGPSSIVVPMELDLEIIYGGTALVGGGNIGLQWGSTAALGGVVATATASHTVANGWNANSFYRLPGITGGAFAPSIVNVGLYLSCDTENFFLGNSTYNAYLKYYIISGTTI